MLDRVARDRIVKVRSGVLIVYRNTVPLNGIDVISRDDIMCCSVSSSHVDVNAAVTGLNAISDNLIRYSVGVEEDAYGIGIDPHCAAIMNPVVRDHAPTTTVCVDAICRSNTSLMLAVVNFTITDGKVSA